MLAGERLPVSRGQFISALGVYEGGRRAIVVRKLVTFRVTVLRPR